MVSPANTHPGLTHKAAGGGVDEPHIYYPTGVRNYVRVTAPADFDGAAGAVLAHELGLRRVYVLRSAQGIGETVAIPFTRAARRLGMKVTGSATWDAAAGDYDPLLRRVAAARPDGVFIGDALFPNTGEVVKALRERLGSKVTVIGGDALQPPRALHDAAGRAAIGVYLTTTALAHEGLGPAGKRLVRELGKTQPVPSATYVTETAAAAEVLLAAIARSDGTRESVTKELRRVRIENGILGSFGFDENGDITPADFTVFKLTGSKKVGSNLPDPFRGAVVDRIVRVPERLVR
jgi:branched-chain amino acid transport system substrate-binding protein